MMEKKYKGKTKAGILLMFIIGIICTMTIVANMGFQEVEPKSWHVIYEWTPLTPLGAENSTLGAGAGGILEIFFYPHAADPATTYSNNNSATLESGSLAWSSEDDFNKEIVHTTKWDFVCRVRGNNTQCWRTDKWWDTDLKVEWTASGGGVSAGPLNLTTGYVTANSTGNSFLWMNFVDNNGHAGYAVNKDGTCTVSSIKFSYYG